MEGAFSYSTRSSGVHFGFCGRWEAREARGGGGSVAVSIRSDNNAGLPLAEHMHRQALCSGLQYLVSIKPHCILLFPVCP